MDKILFRAKEKKNNTWVYGSYIQKGDTHLILPKGQYRSKKIHLYTLGQYVTTDPYGCDVYEGDILQIDNEYLAMVNFDDERRGFALDSTTLNEPFEDNITEFFVVGNKYDNPELVKEIEKRE